ncbi:MAG: integral rane protein, partial [Candidatus Acidoferrum typicum]|nr:integral rane protein [Candidatus Acidoferrum typicum]
MIPSRSRTQHSRDRSGLHFLVVMPLLSRAKRKVGRALGSAAMHADAKQTEFCTYLSTILLAGLLLNAFCGLWWADSVAALIMVPIIAK